MWFLKSFQRRFHVSKSAPLICLVALCFFSTGCSVHLRFGNQGSLKTGLTTTLQPPHALQADLIAGLDDSGGVAVNAVGTAARFSNPQYITSDGTNLYITDLNETVRQMVISTGEVTKLAGITGDEGFFDFSGSADSTDGTGATPTFGSPEGILMFGGSIYVADAFNETIRKVDPTTGNTITFAGDGSNFEFDTSSGQTAFLLPYGLATDGTSLFVSDLGGNTIRKVDLTTANTTTIAGNFNSTTRFGDSTDGSGDSAYFTEPSGIAIDSTNSFLYVVDAGNYAIRKVVIATGDTTTLAGAGGVKGTNDSTDGTGATARFTSPMGIAANSTTLYVSDNNMIRKIDIATGNTTTIAGVAGVKGPTDSTDGTGATARFMGPSGLFLSGTTLYMTDASQGGTIRTVSTLTGNTVTIAGENLQGTSNSTDGTGATARFTGPGAMASDGTNLYTLDVSSDTIRKSVIATGATSTLAGSPGVQGLADSTDGMGDTARFNMPEGIAIVGSTLYVADYANAKIRAVSTLTGNTATLAGSSFGNADSSDGTGATAKFGAPQGITTDGIYLYTVDVSYDTIRKVAIANGDTTTVAGTGAGGYADSSDGTGATAQFEFPKGIVVVESSLYVTDTLNQVIRKVDVATGNTTTFAGQHGVKGLANGIGTAATFTYPADISSDGTSLYVSDSGLIRSINLSTGEVGTYFGPGGVIDLAANLMPSINGVLYTTQGLFFTNDYSGIYLIH